jgi:hypothetical protein
VSLAVRKRSREQKLVTKKGAATKLTKKMQQRCLAQKNATQASGAIETSDAKKVRQKSPAQKNATEVTGAKQMQQKHSATNKEKVTRKMAPKITAKNGPKKMVQETGLRK